MRTRFVSVLTFVSNPVVAIGGALVIGGIVVGFAWHSATLPTAGATATVARGNITEEVDVSGVVKAAQRTDLSFQTSGRVDAIRVAVGDHVFAGQMLVALDSASQAAAVALARANLEAQQAKLASLNSGTRPEQLAIDETNVIQSENALSNALSTAYTNADDAIHVKADQLFTNPRNPSAQLAILVPDATLANRIQEERIALEPVLSSWRAALAPTAGGENDVASSEANLKSVISFLGDLTTALAETQPGGSISSATLSGYQTSVQAGRLNVSTTLAALISADTSYKSATGVLTLAQAGTAKNDLDAQRAAVDAAVASVSAAEAAASQAVIAAPVSGTITAQNANLGQTVVPGVPLVSMIADGKYQADAQVSEADIAKVKVNDAVEATFTEFPGTTFAATVTTVSPAAAMSGGVASYVVTVTFNKADPRLISGLSANLHIITATKNNVLIVPTSSIITNVNQKFVYIENARGSIQTLVTTGIASQDGMTEITSGLSVGDSVRTFGALAQ